MYGMCLNVANVAILGLQRRLSFAQYEGVGTGFLRGTAVGVVPVPTREGPMGRETRKQLEQALDFEQTQLTLLEQQAAKRPPTEPVQLANWPELVASHARAIAFYKARLADLDEGDC